MTTTSAPPKPNIPPPPGETKPTASTPAATAVTGFARIVPNAAPRIILMAEPGWGKTTLAVQAPDSAIIMAEGERGYDTLLAYNRAPSIDAMTVTTWTDLLATLRQLTVSCPYKWITLDAMGGFERLCHAHVCKRDFKNDWTDKGFGSFMRGYEVSLNDWTQFLQILEVLTLKGIGIIILSHSQIKNHRNPIGSDFDKYVPNIHHKTWSATHQWADCVLFGKFMTITDKQDGRTKGIGGTERIIYTTQSDAYDAKNRFGLPEAIEVPNDYRVMWSTLSQFLAVPFQSTKGV